MERIKLFIWWVDDEEREKGGERERESRQKDGSEAQSVWQGEQRERQIKDFWKFHNISLDRLSCVFICVSVIVFVDINYLGQRSRGMLLVGSVLFCFLLLLSLPSLFSLSHSLTRTRASTHTPALLYCPSRPILKTLLPVQGILQQYRTSSGFGLART